jgi:hypothetical protein
MKDCKITAFLKKDSLRENLIKLNFAKNKAFMQLWIILNHGKSVVQAKVRPSHRRVLEAVVITASCSSSSLLH